jgi:hypothetical protein
LAGLRTVLDTFGLKLAESPRRALLSLLWRRGRVALRGLSYREHSEADIPVGELRRVDVCWSVAMGLAMVDTIRSTDFQAQHLLFALDAGEPYRVARALAMEGAFRGADSAHARGRARADELLELGSRLAARIGHPHAIGLCELAWGVTAYLRGEWKRSHERCTTALEILRESCTNVIWETNTAQQFAMVSLARLGHFAELSRIMPQLRRSARERGDLYASLVMRSGMGCLSTLAADEPERAREDITEAHAKWSQQGFHLQHYWELYGRSLVDLYVGDGRTVLDRLTSRWPVIEKSLLLRVHYNRCEAIHLRATAALSTAQRLLPADPEREQLLRAAERDARLLAGEEVPWTPPLARLVHAGIAASRGQTALAISLLDEAVALLEATDMFLHAAVARRRRGELEGGDSGQALVHAADAWMAEQKIKSPRRMCALYAPGFPD